VTRPHTRRRALALAAAAATLAALPAAAENRTVIDAKVDLALKELFATVDGSEDLYNRAVGVLIMPDIVKGGLIVGGAYGEGALRVGGQSVEYYSVAAASIGLQIGVQSSKQALFFMTDEALARFRRADGWEAGVDAEVTFPGAGVNVGADTTTRNAPVVAIVFGEDGLLAGASLEGAKYSRVNR
jgi:lipid-binding SYLF domain-containing protein